MVCFVAGGLNRHSEMCGKLSLRVISLTYNYSLQEASDDLDNKMATGPW